MAPSHKCIHEEELGRVIEVSSRNTKNIDDLFEWRDKAMIDISSAMKEHDKNSVIWMGIMASIPSCVLQAIYLWMIHGGK